MTDSGFVTPSSRTEQSDEPKRRKASLPMASERFVAHGLDRERDQHETTPFHRNERRDDIGFQGSPNDPVRQLNRRPGNFAIYSAVSHPEIFE